MAAVVIPGQPRRWGNESTNFFQDSYTKAPGVASREKVYRCEGSQYTNCGHYHGGTKTLNTNQPLDRYGTPVARKLRSEDQRLPRALMTSTVQTMRMSPDQPVNMYQSHYQKYHSYTMSKAPLKRSSSEELGGPEALARSLSKSFYITSYQSDIAKHVAQRTRSNSASDSTTLQDNMLSRRNSVTGVASSSGRPYRVPSAPPVSRIPLADRGSPPKPLLLQRRRSFSALQRSYPSKGEMLKDIFVAFPSPQPEAPSKRQGRPSSAVTLRAGKIPDLRSQRAQAWI